MSFGFSVGDFLAGAQLAYTLGKALSDSKGSGREYRELIAQLDAVHKVLLQVEQLRAAKQLAQATVNALLFTVNSTNEIMEAFLEENEAYNKSLKPGGSGNSIKDLFRKGKWVTQMGEKVRNLKTSLAAMLAAINCLVSLACYYNTGYDPRCDAWMEVNYRHASAEFWNDVKVEAMIKWDEVHCRTCPGFQTERSPDNFFRPGQIFATQVNSILFLRNCRGFREVDFGRLPLKPISTLQAVAEVEHLEDRRKRLAQIRKLPLQRMTVYCEDLPLDRARVKCLLCKGRFREDVYAKDFWAEHHFRCHHWHYYFSIVPEKVSSLLKKDKRKYFISRAELAKPALGSTFSADEWIILEDVTLDNPIDADELIIEKIDRGTAELWSRYRAGPVMIQRFVVVREGQSKCLCVGIHTYARTGCGAQPDQDLFATIHSGKEVPAPLPNETGMVLSAIRMKPEHPSKALPQTARIHFGRAYEIDHNLPVQSLGLVHDASMEIFLDQFEAKVCRMAKEQEENDATVTIKDNDDSKVGDDCDEKPEPPSSEAEVGPADVEIVREIRKHIEKVLGSELSPEVLLPSAKNS